MSSFFDEIASNNMKSILLLLAFFLLFSFVILVFVSYIGGGPVAFGVGIAMVAAYAAYVFFLGDKLILKMSGSKEADRKQYPGLYEVVGGLAVANQIPIPKVYIVQDPNPNAFATGRNKKSASISVTTGLLNTMNTQELEGVLAHEISHIYDNDIRYMMVAVVFAGAIGIAAAFIRNMFWFGGIGGRNRQGGDGIIIVALLIGLLAPLFAMLIRLALSRKREYMADANGARIIRNPGALSSALRKIQKYSQDPRSTQVKNVNEVTAPLYFANPLSKANLMNLFSTHPPIQERIDRLEHMY